MRAKIEPRRRLRKSTDPRFKNRGTGFGPPPKQAGTLLVQRVASQSPTCVPAVLTQKSTERETGLVLLGKDRVSDSGRRLHRPCRRPTGRLLHRRLRSPQGRDPLEDGP